MRNVGPVKVIGDEVNDEVMVPLATYESPLWPSVGRGARVTKLAGGIRATVIDDRMSRSILLEADNASVALQAVNSIKARIVEHNMVTNAADRLFPWVLEQYPQLKYVSISANYCSDKKATAVNGILGRGKYVVTEVTIPRELCLRRLSTTPEKVVELNIKKNLIGTLLAGGLRSANAHYANMLLAFYLATGQDAANIVEGSQGLVHAEVREGDLYFSATLPNLIMGSVGNGKGLDFVEKNLQLLGCKETREPGARRLAIWCAATVLCGELSLMAAQTNPGELMQSHLSMER